MSRKFLVPEAKSLARRVFVKYANTHLVPGSLRSMLDAAARSPSRAGLCYEGILNSLTSTQHAPQEKSDGDSQKNIDPADGTS